MLDTEGTPNIYIERKKPAWFLFITLPHRHFVDVADNLVKREIERVKIEETVSKQETVSSCEAMEEEAMDAALGRTASFFE